MFTIQGSKGVATCYATNIEDECVKQIKNMLDMEFASGVNIAIMPDAHFGIGCTIGTTMEIKDMVVPNLVGIDLGCGMLTANVGQANINLSNFDDACHLIPSGNIENRKEKPRMALIPQAIITLYLLLDDARISPQPNLL